MKARGAWVVGRASHWLNPTRLSRTPHAEMKTSIVTLLALLLGLFGASAPLRAQTVEFFSTPRVAWPEPLPGEPLPQPIFGFVSNPFGWFEWDGGMLSIAVSGEMTDDGVGSDWPYRLSIGTLVEATYTMKFEFTGGPLVSAYAPMPEMGLPGMVTWYYSTTWVLSGEELALLRNSELFLFVEAYDGSGTAIPITPIPEAATWGALGLIFLAAIWRRRLQLLSRRRVMAAANSVTAPNPSA